MEKNIGYLKEQVKDYRPGNVVPKDRQPKEGGISEKHMKVIRWFQSTHPNAMVTGTCALVLYGFDLGRTPTDVDFILPEMPTSLPDEWRPLPMPLKFQAKAYYTYMDGVRIEVIVWGEYSPNTINGIKVARVADIIEAKMDLFLTGTLKHAEDFYRMLIQLVTGGWPTREQRSLKNDGAEGECIICGKSVMSGGYCTDINCDGYVDPDQFRDDPQNNQTFGGKC